MARIDRAGRFDFTLLFARPVGSPEQVEIEIDGGGMVIQARDGDWYEAPRCSSLNRLLRDGFVAATASDDELQATWMLSSGRTLFIFSHDGKLGWANQPRLRLGLPQIILCEAPIRDAVSRILDQACGAPMAEALGGGAPEGWHVFGLVKPVNVLPAVPGEDLLNLMRPSAEIEISLDGGLWLRASEWLEGFPPEIRIIGQLPASETILIDQIGATQSESGTYVTSDSSSPGFHTVACAGRTASYTITGAPREWDQTAGFRSSKGAVTGAFAQPAGDASHTLVTTRMTHRILIGAKPGDWFACSLRGGESWRGLAPFDPVWALPADPLHCDRERTKIKLCGNQNASPVERLEKRVTRRSATAVNRWCMAILDCRRKGLKLEQPELADRWTGYLAEARRLRRLLRHDGNQ